MANGVRDQVFVSYSHEDAAWWERLRKVLAPMVRANPKAIWWDGFIAAGQTWREEIQQGLDAARVALLLVSPAFLASEFILKVELPTILNAAETQGVRILWCLVRNCWYKRTPIERYQAVHDPGKAWNALGEAELDALLVKIAETIDEALRADQVPAPSPAPPAVEPAATVPPEPTGPDDSRVSAEKLLKDVKELKTVDEIGNLFVLRHRWAGAEYTYDRMITLAAPDREIWMAQGYEKLGLVRQNQGKEKSAGECFRLAQSLYRRNGRADRSAELGERLRKLQIPATGEPRA